MSAAVTPRGPEPSSNAVPERGGIVDTRTIPTTVPVIAWEIAILIAIVVAGSLVLIITYLVVSGHLHQIYLTALVADSEAGLVLATIYLLVIELRRDREDRETKDLRYREDRRRREAAEKEQAGPNTGQPPSAK